MTNDVHLLPALYPPSLLFLLRPTTNIEVLTTSASYYTPAKPKSPNNSTEMVLPKSKTSVGLGNSLMNDRFGRGKGADRKKVSQQGVVRTDHATGQSYV